MWILKFFFLLFFIHFPILFHLFFFSFNLSFLSSFTNSFDFSYNGTSFCHLFSASSYFQAPNVFVFILYFYSLYTFCLHLQSLILFHNFLIPSCSFFLFDPFSWIIFSSYTFQINFFYLFPPFQNVCFLNSFESSVSY